MKNKNVCKFIMNQNYDKLDVFRFIYETNQEIVKKPVSLSYHRICLVKCGRGILTINNQTSEYESGCLIFLFKHETAVFLPEDNCEYFYIDFDGTRSVQLFERFDITVSNRIFSGYDGLLPFWQESLYRAQPINLDLVSEGVLLYTFSKLVAKDKNEHPIIDKVIEIAENNFSDPALSISVIAEELSYNTKYLSHKFKNTIGINFSEYLQTLRVQNAISLFELGLDSVKNIAFLCGFNDPLYFSTVFKKHTGVSPKEYKESTDAAKHPDKNKFNKPQKNN